MVEVIFNFNELHCIHQYDGGGPSEPYLWIVFFYVDSSTLTSGQDFVATRNMRSNISCRKIFEENVRPGKTIAIPETLGRVRLLLDDTVLASPAAGAVYALLEENGTTDSLMQIGHRVFGQEFHREINDYVRSHIPDVPPLSAADRDAIAARIQDKVFDAVHDAADFYEYFRSKDRVIGFASEYFPWPALTLLRDRTPGQPYAIPQTIRLERTVTELNHPVQAIDEYEIRGSIQVNPYTPPAPDPCQALKDAYNRAEQRVSDIEDALRRLREAFAQASPSERESIRQDIEEAVAEKAAALNEAEKAMAAYKNCRAQYEIRTKEFTF
jgi:hypothetical protein